SRGGSPPFDFGGLQPKVRENSNDRAPEGAPRSNTLFAVAAKVTGLIFPRKSGMIREPPTPKMPWERGPLSARRGGSIGRGGINSALRHPRRACRACRSAGILAGPLGLFILFGERSSWGITSAATD